MSKPYKVTAPRPVLDAEPGTEVEFDLTAQEEADLVAAGRLEILPREYRNVGTSVVHDAEPGKKFTAALTAGQEQALIQGGHIEVVVKQAARAASTRGANAAKEV